MSSFGEMEDWGKLNQQSFGADESSVGNIADLLLEAQGKIGMVRSHAPCYYYYIYGCMDYSAIDPQLTMSKDRATEREHNLQLEVHSHLDKISSLLEVADKVWPCTVWPPSPISCHVYALHHHTRTRTALHKIVDQCAYRDSTV